MGRGRFVEEHCRGEPQIYTAYGVDFPKLSARFSRLV
jgi:hypothetical protein